MNTMVVRPIITYAATVWWPRVKFKTSKVELSKLKRMASLGFSGAIKTALTAAIEVSLDPPPLYLQLETEVKADLLEQSMETQI
jgi:hypothetical protein